MPPRAGSTLTVPACTYHETVTISKKLTVNAKGAVIDGDNVRTKGLEIKANDVVVDGLTVKRILNGAHVGAVQATSVSRFTFKNGVARDSATVCIVLGGGYGFQILNSEFTGCGQEGYFLNNVTDSVFQREPDPPQQHAAQVLWLGVRRGQDDGERRITFDRNEVAYNRGPGIWFDNGVRDVEATNNRVHDNDSEGIFFEISDGARIAGNAVWNNGFANPRWAYGAGITISSSNNAEVDHNTVAWNARGISVISQNRGSQPHHGIRVYTNTVIGSAGDKVAGWYDDHGGTLYNAANGNGGWGGRYWVGVPEPTSYRYEWAGGRSTVAAYNATPGEEGAINLTTAQRDAALTAAGIPTGALPAVIPGAPASPPAISFRGGTVGTTAPGRYSWPASASAVAYRLQVQVDGGAWQNIALPEPDRDLGRYVLRRWTHVPDPGRVGCDREPVEPMAVLRVPACEALPGDGLPPRLFRHLGTGRPDGCLRRVSALRHGINGHREGDVLGPIAACYCGWASTMIRTSVMSSIAQRRPSRPRPLSFTPPYGMWSIR